MPTISKLWRAIVAALAGLCIVVMGVVPARAADPASVFIPDSTFTSNKVDFVVSGTNIAGKTIKAIKVANYTQVQVDAYPNPTKMVGYDVTDAGHAAQIAAAITAAGIDTSKTGQTGVAYSPTNPMPWLIANLKDSKTSPWAGKLRNVLTKLGDNSDFTGAEDDTVTVITAGDGDNSITFSLGPGVYVFVDTTTALRTDEPYSSLSIPMMNGSGIKVKNLDEQGAPLTPPTSEVKTLVTANGTFDLGTAEYKGTVPTIEKKIVDGTNEVDSASQGIGQEVTFKLKTIVPNWTGYKKYQLFLSDTLGAGLTFKKITSVKLPAYTVGTTTLAEVDLTGSNVANGYGTDWTLDPTSPTTLAALQTVPARGAESSFTMWFAPSAAQAKNSDLVTAAAAANSPWVDTNIGRPLEVTYKAVVNRHAVINGAGNTNKVNLTFSNKPNDGTSTEVTPDDEVKVYTGEINLTKTDMSGAALAGAEFKIYRGSETNPVHVVKTADGQYRVSDATLVDRGSDRATTEADLNDYTDTLVTPSTGKLVISGLAGNYTVKETKSPYAVAEYLLPDFSFSIATAVAQGAPTATSTIPNFNGDAKLTATGLVSLENNTVHFTVKNPRSLLDMPKTGSIWLLIYGVAALVCAIAAYFLLFRRRSAED